MTAKEEYKESISNLIDIRMFSMKASEDNTEIQKSTLAKDYFFSEKVYNKF